MPIQAPPPIVSTLVLPAAGFGTRMRSVNPDLPKELLPLGIGRVMDFALREARDAGIRDIVVVTRPGKEILREYLDKNWTRARIRFVLQETPSGEGDAILRAREFLGGAPFAVLYPDNVGHPAPGMLRELCAAFAPTGRDTVALSPVTPDTATALGNSGRVRLEDGPDGLRRIREFLPKGPGSFPLRGAMEWRTCGLFIALPHFLDAVEEVRRRGFPGELTDGKVRRVLLERGVEFLGAPLARTVHDVGNPEGYRRLRKLANGDQDSAIPSDSDQDLDD